MLIEEIKAAVLEGKIDNKELNKRTEMCVLYMEKGHGSYKKDCDTNEYNYMLNNNTYMKQGHKQHGTLES